MPSPGSDHAISSRWEGLCVAGLVLIVLLLSLLTGSRCPAVWIDEVAYTDPAWNLLDRQCFTSTAWYAQDGEEFWAGNVPLHPAILYLWMNVFGTSVLAVRSLNYVFMSCAVPVLWLAVKRLGLVSQPGYRIAMVALTLSGFGVLLAYRGGRPDAICVLLAAAALLAYSIRRQTIRLAVLGALGLLFPIAGLQLVMLVGLLCLLLLPFLRTQYLREAVVLGIGCLLGGALLYGFYSYHGVWDAFLASTIHKHSVLGGMEPLRRLGRLELPGGVKDPSFFIVLIAVLTVAGWSVAQRQFRWRSPLGVALAVGLGMPTVLYGIRGQYPCYYSWMTYVPLCVCLCAELAARSATLPVALRRFVLPGLLGLACVVGLPLVSVLTAVQWHDRDYRRVEELLRGQVHPEDFVYCDCPAYYALKPLAPVDSGYIRLQTMTQEEKDRISVLVVDPDSLSGLEALIGADWRPCSEALRPSQPTLPGVRSQYFFERYKLQVFRREGDAVRLARSGRAEIASRETESVAR